jgi:hypothetical protein
MTQKLARWAEALHFPLWILKDAAWFFGLGWLSLVLALPVVVLGAAVAWHERGIGRWEWALLTLWLLANSVWMASERLGLPHWSAEWAWYSALLALPFYLWALRGHLKKKK